MKIWKSGGEGELDRQELGSKEDLTARISIQSLYHFHSIYTADY